MHGGLVNIWSILAITGSLYGPWEWGCELKTWVYNDLYAFSEDLTTVGSEGQLDVPFGAPHGLHFRQRWSIFGSDAHLLGYLQEEWLQWDQKLRHSTPQSKLFWAGDEPTVWEDSMIVW